MVIITLKTILNEKIGYNFCQVILSFWLREKVVPYKNYEIQKYLWIFLSQALATPRKKTNDPHRGRDPRLKPTVLKYLRTLSKQGCGACVCKIIPQKSPAAKCFWKWLINVGIFFASSRRVWITTRIGNDSWGSFGAFVRRPRKCDFADYFLWINLEILWNRL